MASWVVVLLLATASLPLAQTIIERRERRERQDEETLRGQQREGRDSRRPTRDMRIQPVDEEAERRNEILGEKEPQEPDPDERMPALGLASLDRVLDRSVYVLGPGDILMFSILGSTVQVPEIEITPDGRLIVPEFGPVDVAGLTLDEAERRVSEVAAESYANAQISLSILRIRQFRVHVAGLVEYPGSYIATAAQRVSDMIVKSGGLLDGASTRRLKLTRADGEELLVDLDGFLKGGDKSANPTLDMGDVISVPSMGEPVMISGAVGTPGEYEYRPGDSVERLIAIAGGLTDNAQTSRIEWTTFTNDTTPPVIREMDLSRVLADRRLNGSLKAHDHIYIPPRTGWRRLQTVSVEGEVLHPGRLTIYEGETRISDVIRRAGGLTDQAYAGGSFVVRIPPEPGVDQEFDRIAEAMQYMELNSEETRFYRARSRQLFGVLGIDLEKALANPGGPDDMLLLDGDEIVVVDRVVTVEVIGQVGRPGLYRYEDGLTYEEYIERAGGFAWHSRPGSVRVIRGDTGNWIEPNGSTPIEPGDRIFVPQRENFDYWELTKDVVNLTSQVATIILLIITIGKA